MHTLEVGIGSVDMIGDPDLCVHRVLLLPFELGTYRNPGVVVMLPNKS